MTLTTKMTGNTCETIGRCLHYIYNYFTQSSLRVSVLYNWGPSLYAIGDDLEAVDPDASRVRKKRWWELSDSSQLKLPFALYSPARILRLCQSYNEENYTLYVSKGETNNRSNCPLQFYRDSQSDSFWGAIKAIRVHELVAETSYPNPFSPSRDRYVTMTVEAANAGILVSTYNHVVYNKATGERVGRDLVMHPSLPMEQGALAAVPSLMGRLTMLDDRLINLHFASVEWIV